MHKSVYKLKKQYSFTLFYVHKRAESVTSNGERTLEVENYNRLKNFSDIPGPSSYRFVGTLYKYLPLIGDYNAETLDKNAWINWKRYGYLTRESLMPDTQLLHVFHPDDMASVFRQEDRLPARRSHLAMQHYRLSKPHVYNTGGLLSTNGPDWWKLRSTFQKNFTSPKSVKGHVHSTDKVVVDFVNWIQQIISLGITDFLPYLNRLNLEVIGIVAFNERFNSFTPDEQNAESRSSKIISAAFGSNSGIMKLDKGFLWKIFETPLYRKLRASQEYLEKTANDILYRNIEFYENVQRENNGSLLESFLQQPDVDLKDITGMMVDILMASIDTTAYSTSFVLYHLAQNAECQEKVFEEVSKLIPFKDSVLTADLLSKATYTRACVKESLRLNPVSIGVGRILQKDITLRGYKVPKGTVIVTQNMVASRLPQFVKKPLIFKPERWIRNSEYYENIHPFLSLPFGFGPRSCIARRLAEQNITITIIRLVRAFKLKWKGNKLGIRTHLINKPDQPVRIEFLPRSV